MTTTDLRTPTVTELLTDEMLARFDARAPGYDRDNRFFDEDFAELRESGYLKLAVPTQSGGSGLGLNAYSQLARRLGYVAPATALAVNMHVYWTGVAADLARAGNHTCDFITRMAAADEILCAIHGERGNDLPLFLSTSTASRTDGGWLISGHKMFGSLGPVWTFAGVHAMDTTDPAGPRIIHGFIPRDSAGVKVLDTWDTLGMRATQSQDTVFDGAFLPDELTMLVCPAGMAGAGPLQVGIFAWALLGFASVYLGAARRAFDLTIEAMPRRTSIAMHGSMARHPEVQHHVAKMRMALDTAEALLDRTVADWANGVEHPDWPVRIVGARQTVINLAYEIVDRAMDLSGGAASFKSNRLEQIFRDVRMGRFHPGNALLAPELIGKLCLGIDPDESPRWG